MKLPPNMWRKHLNSGGYAEQAGTVPSALKSRKQNLTRIRDIEELAKAGFGGAPSSPVRRTAPQTPSATKPPAEAGRTNSFEAQGMSSAATPRSSTQVPSSSAGSKTSSTPATPRNVNTGARTRELATRGVLPMIASPGEPLVLVQAPVNAKSLVADA